MAGAVVNRSAAVVGVSNLFAVDGDLGASWAGVLPALGDRHVVGYESGPALDAAVGLGFTTLGPLRIWLRTGSD